MDRTTLFRKKPIEEIRRDAELGFGVEEALVPGEPVGAGEPHLRRALGVWDLTSFGIAAIIGAGIFSTIGNAAYHGGPGVTLLFVFTAIACAFSALCYAEFASRVPVSGSAYTYAYASFGELIAWIIGWDLLIEYAIGNIAVAISWSDYFTGLLSSLRIGGMEGIHLPAWMTMDYLSAARGHAAVSEVLGPQATAAAVASNADLSRLSEAFTAWTSAPRLGPLRVIADLPALVIVALVTMLVYVGIRESKRASNAMVLFKLLIIFVVIGVGAFFVDPDNWSPFAPNGITGVLRGVSGVFFAYIGFDAITTTAEEARNPRRDLPRAMFYSLAICTVLYILIALVLTGMVDHTQLQVGDPLAFVFGPEGANIPWLRGVVAISAVVAMTTVLLVFQLGQPRIWMAMSRDGLLPPVFAAIHPRFKTPWFATLMTGLLVAVPALFMNLTEVTDLTSIGTLFAFVLVSGGVLLLDGGARRSGNYVKYVDSRWIVPVLYVGIWIWALVYRGGDVASYFRFTDPDDPSLSTWEVFRHEIPFLVFLVGSGVLAVLCFVKRLSLIPVLGVLTCGYLMTELGLHNWIRFGIWLAIGLVLYFVYGYRHSRLGREAASGG
ncbi:MAG TPA: amino acid permease [Gemmatimonadales bacterium]|nr:amino acid permease [Gemmatimonadales bacterium]